jgi:putative tricarboxylic transport membrane protein
MVFVAIISCLMRRWGISVAPMVISFVLGRSIESSMRQALIISGGKTGYFFSSPIGNVFYILSMVILLMPFIRGTLAKRSGAMQMLKEYDEVE